MAKKTKAKKKMSFRQRLRNQSAERLEAIEAEIVRASDKVLADLGANLMAVSVMRLISGSQTKTLREDLITILSNQTEAELESIFNRQMELLKEDPDGDEKETS